MINLDNQSMDQLVILKNKLIDDISMNYSDELDHDNDNYPSDKVRKLITDYKVVCGEIASRESRVRKFERITSSHLPVSKYYKEMENYSQNFITVSNDWYSAHHDYRASMI